MPNSRISSCLSDKKKSDEKVRFSENSWYRTKSGVTRSRKLVHAGWWIHWISWPNARLNSLRQIVRKRRCLSTRANFAAGIDPNSAQCTWGILRSFFDFWYEFNFWWKTKKGQEQSLSEMGELANWRFRRILDCKLRSNIVKSRWKTLTFPGRS